MALRLIAERQLEIEAFDPVEYWTIGLQIKTAENALIQAQLTEVPSQTIIY